jgi:hypothetical protein
MSAAFWRTFVASYRFHRSVGTVGRWRSVVEALRSARAQARRPNKKLAEKANVHVAL